MSAATSLDDLQERLSRLKPGANYLDVLAALRPPESPAVIEARRRCALVRSFDSDLYDFLTKGIEETPKLKELLESGDAQSFGEGRWVLSDSVRAPLLRSWQSDKNAEWKEWNEKIAQYFVARGRADERLDALYHMAASTNPDSYSEYFEKWYGEADDEFDLAECNALLEILKLQASFRGQRLSADWQSYRQYYQARVLYGDEYFKTGAYFQREVALKQFEPLLKPGAKQWIFHIHATGGTGKTMFLRWLASRYLVPKRIPCAQVDLDDFSLSKVLEYPGMLFAEAIDQWAEQVQEFRDLRARMQRELDLPDWNPAVPAEIGRQIRGAQLHTHLVLILDTLEDVTRTAQSWLKKGIERLGELRKIHPQLVVILSGRYDIATLTDALPAGEYVSFELPRFSNQEAHAYLESRGIRAGGTRDAIVERAGETAELEDGADKLKGRNPFKLAMFAELALNNPDMSPKDVRELPRVDIAYLIERVIMRIASQPLRWAIRYGVIARHFDKRFIDAVMLPSLREALRGGGADKANEKIPSKYGAIWEPDADLAESITTEDIWLQLKSYARDRGWVSLNGSETENNEELRFHPDVVAPMRDLLRQEPVFYELQRRAAEYFEERSQLFGKEDLRDKIPLLSVPDAMEAVYHHFQKDGAAAQKYWLQTLRTIETVMGPLHAVPYAAEITGRDYAIEQVRPLEQVSTPEVLRAAHCEVADLILQGSDVSFAFSGNDYTEFRRRVEWATQVSEAYRLAPVPSYLQAIREATLSERDASIAQLNSALAGTREERERVFLIKTLADKQFIEHKPDAAASCEQLLELVPRTRRTGLDPFDIAMNLADLYMDTGQYDAVGRSFDRARKFARGYHLQLAQVAAKAADFALKVDDIPKAIEHIDELEVVDRKSKEHVELLVWLKIELARARGDALNMQELVKAELKRSTGSTRLPLLEQLGLALAAVLDFNGAFDAFEEALVGYDKMNAPKAATYCALRAARLKALGCGNINDATTMLGSAMRLSGIQYYGNYVELRLLQAYCFYRGGLVKEAREVVRDARGQEKDLGAELCAQIAFFGIVFGIYQKEEELLSALADIALVDPPSARGRLLDWCHYSEERLDLSKETRKRLEQLFEIDSNNGIPLAARLGRAQLLRLLGEEKRAAAYLIRCQKRKPSKLSVGGSMEHWLTQRGLQKLGAPTSFGALLDEIPRKEKRSGNWIPLFDAYLVEAALEAADAGDKKKALKIAEEGIPFAKLHSEGTSMWIARIEEAEHRAYRGAPLYSNARSMSTYIENLGDKLAADRIRDKARRVQAEKSALPKLETSAPPSPPGAPEQPGASAPFDPASTMLAPPTASPEPQILTIHISSGGQHPIPEHLIATSRSNEHTIDLLLDDWTRVARDISDYLEGAIQVSRPYVCLEVFEPMVALPWEFASILTQCGKFWRKGSMPPHRFAPSKSENRILLIRPREGSGDIVFESGSGGSLEGVYGAFNGRFQLAVLHDPHPEEVMKELQSFRPDTIHIVATMREATGGLYLDFATSESRADEYVTRRGGNVEQRIKTRLGASQGHDLTWSTTRLARVIQSYRPIDVILDIAASSNLAETVRMLLLRNRFAGELFQLAPLRTLLACGLAHDSERLHLTFNMLERGIAGGVFGALHALREGKPHDDLVRVLPRLGAALWAHGPDDSMPPR